MSQRPVQITLGRLVTWIDAQRLAGGLDTLVPLLHRDVRRRHVVIRLRIRGPQFHRAFRRCQAVLVIPGIAIFRREVEKPFGRGGRFGKRCFELLRDAYVKARYSRHYRITGEELALLIERVEELQAVVEGVCRERLALSPPTRPGTE